MMKRQMYRGGGLGVVPREQYGLGSFLKKTFKKITKPFVKVAQKLVPKEIAKPLMVAAPFLGPYAPLIYAAGSAKATGGIDPMKLALTAAPYVKFEGIKPVGYGGSKYGMFGGEEVGFGKRNISPAQEFDLDPNIKPQGDLRGTSLAQQIDKGASKQFDALAKGKDTASIKEVAIDTITSPTTLISGGVSLAQYIDAKKKENEDKGIEFTEEDYNNAVNEYYAQYSEGFDRGFGQTGGIAQTREKYGNGSGPSGNRLKQLYTLREEAMEKGDDDKVIELDQEIGLILKKYATGGRVQLGEGSDDPEKSQMALDMFGKDIRLLDQDEMDMLDEEYNIKKGIVELAKGGRVQLASGTAEPQNMVSPITEFKKNIGNAIMGIRGGMDQNIVVDMLENQRIQMGIPEEDAKVAVTDFMSSFQGIQ